MPKFDDVGARLREDRYALWFGLLGASCALAFAARPGALLGLDGTLIQGALAALLFLGPVFFAAVIFARLIRKENNLPSAYGSNLLGAMVGGAGTALSVGAAGMYIVLMMP